MKKIINGQTILLANLNSKDFQAKKKINLHNAFKKFIPLLAAFFLFSISSFGNPATHKLNSNKENSKVIEKEKREEKRMVKALENISQITMNLFATQFPDATKISWTTTQGFSEVDFTSCNSQMMVFYDYNNELVGTGKYISYNSLPEKAIGNINKYFKNYTPVNVMFYDDNEENENDFAFFDIPVDTDDDYALMKDNNTQKEIVIQISPDGEVSYFSGLR